MSKIAYTTYEKTLVELRSALRGDEFDKDDFIDRMKLIDEIIIDQSPIADRFSSRYNAKFGKETPNNGGIASPQNPPADNVHII